MLLKMLLLIRMRKLLPLVKLEENKKVVKIQVVKKKKWICHIQQKLDKKLLILLL